MTFNAKEYHKAYNRKHKASESRYLKYNLKQKYGITIEEYENLLKAHNHCCAICKKPGPKLCVDHCQVG